MVGSYLGVWLLVPLALVVYFFGKHLHRNEYKYYLGSLLLALVLGLGVILDMNLWIFQELIVDGYLSFSLFVIVMFGGAFPLRSKPKKYLMQIRREFALIGFLLLIPHAIYRLSFALGGYNFTGLFAFVLIIPLVVVSYPLVRKKIKAITWKRIHKLAYVVYLFIYVHVGFTLYVRGEFRQIKFILDAWPYHLVFLIYIGLKIRVIILKNKKVTTR